MSLINNTFGKSEDLWGVIKLEKDQYVPSVFSQKEPTRQDALFQLRNPKGKPPVGRYNSESPLVDKKLKQLKDSDEAAFNVYKKKQDRDSRYFSLYQNATAQKGDGECLGIRVLGPDLLRNDKNPTVMCLHKECKILSSEEGGTGGILYEKRTWDLLANDIAMLGSIHSCKKIWFSGIKESSHGGPIVHMSRSGHPTLDDRVLWTDIDGGRLRVLGREIAQFRAAGYRVDEDEDEFRSGTLGGQYNQYLGRLPPLTPPHSANAQGVTLRELSEAAKDADLDGIKGYLNL